MPLVHQHKHSHGLIALWYITESVEELHRKLTIDRFTPFKTIKRNRHWLSARLALQIATNHTKSKIKKSPEGKPFLDDQDGHISMSHSGEMAAAMYNKTQSCGIDLELYDQRIERIVHKFTGKTEEDLFREGFYCSSACLLWSAKESVFKYCELHDVNFIEEIQLKEINYENQTLKFHLKRFDPDVPITVFYRVYEAVGEKVYETPLLADLDMRTNERYILTWL